MEKNKKTSAYIAAVAYALIIGLSFLFTKLSLDVTNPIDILAHRFTVSFVAILIPVLFKMVKVNYTKERIKKIIPLAIVYPMLFFGFQTFGMQYATSSEAGILLASAPVFTLILATYFLKEKTTTLQKISVVVSVTGVIYISLMKGSSQEFTNIELSFVMIVISFISFNLLAGGRHLINGSLSTYFAPFTNMNFLISILYLGILSTLVTSLLTNYVLSQIEASKMSVFANLGTVISIVAGVVFLNENIYYYHIIGSILIVGGVLGTNFLGEKRNKIKK